MKEGHGDPSPYRVFLKKSNRWLVRPQPRIGFSPCLHEHRLPGPMLTFRPRDISSTQDKHIIPLRGPCSKFQSHWFVRRDRNQVDPNEWRAREAASSDGTTDSPTDGLSLSTTHQASAHHQTSKAQLSLSKRKSTVYGLLSSHFHVRHHESFRLIPHLCNEPARPPGCAHAGYSRHFYRGIHCEQRRCVVFWQARSDDAYGQQGQWTDGRDAFCLDGVGHQGCRCRCPAELRRSSRRRQCRLPGRSPKGHPRC